jgi:C-terminal processing protease CtpA/Prc
LQSGGQLKLTTAYYYFSDGSTVSQTGLIPNVPISTWQLWRYPPLANELAKNPEDLLNPLLKKAINAIGLE